jgi:hypothetical protein
MAHSRRRGDNTGMARDTIKVRLRLELQLFLLVLDGISPSGAIGWVSTAAPVVTQAAVGAGHWAAGRRQRRPRIAVGRALFAAGSLAPAPGSIG